MNSEDLKNYIKERLNNTFIFTFIVSMGFHYWKVILVFLSSNENVQKKIELLDDLLFQVDFANSIKLSSITAISISILIIITNRISVLLNSFFDYLTLNMLSNIQDKVDKSNNSIYKKIYYIIYKLKKNNDKYFSDLVRTESQTPDYKVYFSTDNYELFREQFSFNNKILNDLYFSYLSNNSDKVIEIFNQFQSADKDSEVFYSMKTPGIELTDDSKLNSEYRT